MPPVRRYVKMYDLSHLHNTTTFHSVDTFRVECDKWYTNIVANILWNGNSLQNNH